MLAAVPCSRVTKIKRVVCFPRSRFRGLAAGSSLTRSRGGGERMDKGWMVKRERKVKRRSRVLAVEEMPRGQAGFLPIRHLVDSFLWFLGSLCSKMFRVLLDLKKILEEILFGKKLFSLIKFHS